MSAKEWGLLEFHCCWAEGEERKVRLMIARTAGGAADRCAVEALAESEWLRGIVEASLARGDMPLLDVIVSRVLGSELEAAQRFTVLLAQPGLNSSFPEKK